MFVLILSAVKLCPLITEPTSNCVMHAVERFMYNIVCKLYSFSIMHIMLYAHI